MSKHINDCDNVDDLRDAVACAVREANRVRTALAAKDAELKGAREVLTAYWLDIETAPLAEDVILGWWEVPYIDVDMPKVWRMKIGWAGASPGMSNGWRDGQATHWRKVPKPPAPNAPAERSGDVTNAIEAAARALEQEYRFAYGKDLGGKVADIMAHMALTAALPFLLPAPSQSDEERAAQLEQCASLPPSGGLES